MGVSRALDFGGKPSAGVRPLVPAAPRRFLPWLALAGLALTAGCASVNQASVPAAVAEIKPGIPVGFLQPGVLPDGLTLLPPPPAPGSAAMAADQAVFRATRAFRNTPRWALAAADAVLTFPQGPAAFSCALDAPITQEATPNLYALLGRSATDANLAAAPTKEHYQRIRPFVFNRQASCTPQDEARLRLNESYPSGHTMIGWTWTLILTELAPERTDRLLSRGYAFGQSRVICGMHWQSDVTASRVLAPGLAARLHADPAFRAQLEAAKAELAVVRAKGLGPTRDCPAEAAALAVTLPKTRHPR